MTVSLVIPALNEAESIEITLRGYFDLEIFDEIIVVDNGSTDQTSSISSTVGAKVIFEPQKGYGRAIRRGLAEVTTDYVVLSEADNSFYPGDVLKLISYSKDFDMVKGARSNRRLVTDDADYGFILKYGNYIIAKFQMFLFYGLSFPGNSSFHEMGGTFRIFSLESYKKIEGKLTENQSAFLADLTSLYLRNNLSVLEIPVRYRKRIGESKITGNKCNAIKLGIKMTRIIIRNRLWCNRFYC
jgi:glycosyltransferase involved in cell wall biosynthesis